MGDTNQFSRTPVYAALVLAVVLVVGVLIGARVVFERAGDQPVALPDLPAGQADSPECTGLIEDLPDSLGDFDRAELAEPAPAGAAAWSKSSTERVTLRCGVDAPAQWTEGAETEESGGVEWLPVTDPDTDLTTWYSVDRSVVVAVTAEGFDPTEELAEPVAALPAGSVERNPLPLADLDTPEAGGCEEVLAALPGEIGDYRRVEAEAPRAHWTARGLPPVVAVCGVAMPESYAPGGQVTEINGVNWFSEGDTLYALGLDEVVAVSTPPVGADGVLVALSDALKEAQ
ncbi:hypothetical protein CFRA_06470 [Corynebacterium frankenforstense DSM 45800]|uniref:DUF3515 domain-containing protein n=1 Tax=Corynebacterium frankenforstense DSM 45800 TaxID=1437875 RepID=A0A1L7CSX6_9CORY|nr:DUF3515 domain-containing protein [Corynebacterium frankenforstense]APT88953.1 hypothetical protein CFRA_06470 [Corynebacterium frankenforstense DSM 45800]